jgi:hypothetical protein
MCQDCQQVIEDLGINIELFFHNLDALPNKDNLVNLIRELFVNLC